MTTPDVEIWWAVEIEEGVEEVCSGVAEAERVTPEPSADRGEGDWNLKGRWIGLETELSESSGKLLCKLRYNFQLYQV